MTAKKRVAILISGRGSNMLSLVEAARAPAYPAEIVIVVSNRPDATGLAWAKEQGIPVVEVQHHHAHLLSVMLEQEIDEEFLSSDDQTILISHECELLPQGHHESFQLPDDLFLHGGFGSIAIGVDEIKKILIPE